MGKSHPQTSERVGAVEEEKVTAALEELVRQSGSTLGELCGLSTRSVAELLVETGDARRFTEGGFRRFNATAPLPVLPAIALAGVLWFITPWLLSTAVLYAAFGSLATI